MRWTARALPASSSTSVTTARQRSSTTSSTEDTTTTCARLACGPTTGGCTTHSVMSQDRLFLVGAGGPGIDVDATVAELTWVADHGFHGTYPPGFLSYPGQLPIVRHVLGTRVERSVKTAACPCSSMLVSGRSKDTSSRRSRGSRRRSTRPAVRPTSSSLGSGEEVLAADFFADVAPRRPMWQLMFGGVFDRHPELKLVMTEVRADWIPATLRYLDEVYLRHRADLPAKRMPSEYWHTNCLVSVSFPHRAESAMRYEMGSRRSRSAATTRTTRAPGRTPRHGSVTPSTGFPRTSFD